MMLYAASVILLGAVLVDGAVARERYPVTTPAASETSPRTQDSTMSVADSLTTVTLQVEGMTCGGCAIAVRRVLKRLDGVEKVDVTYETKRAVVHYDPAKVGTEQMVEAVETLRYTAKVVPNAVAAPPDSGAVKRG